jgi:hypothetical protein
LPGQRLKKAIRFFSYKLNIPGVEIKNILKDLKLFFGEEKVKGER